MSAVKPPAGLKAAGRALWRAVLADYELAEHERRLLVEACRTVDLCADLQALVDAQGPVLGTAEHPKAHPAAVELRQHRIVLARLIAALRIPLDDLTDRTQSRPIRGVYTLRASS